MSISGGDVYVYVTGDGLDSNSSSNYSSIIFDGANIVVVCNSKMNSSIDTERGYAYKSGNVLAVMNSDGMSNGATHCNNFNSIGTSKRMSLTSGNYLIVKVDNNVKISTKMPCGLNAMVVYLGCNNAKFSTSKTNE